jgi:glycosyltransferase involved in cell wall biosynthesis
MDEHPPFFSVITVVRNGMPYIAQTMQSVLMQTESEYEYIVIDGASTDGTMEIVRNHASQLTSWCSEPDKGIADAFNKGLGAAKGDYILFLNADDALAHSKVLSEVAADIASSNWPALFYGDYTILQRESGMPRYTGRVTFSTEKLRYGQVLPHPCLFTHRSYFEKYGNFDTGFSIAMDYEWLLRGIRQERVVHMPRVITLIKDGGISTQDREQVVDEIIRAQIKHGMINGYVAESGIRVYFAARAIMRRMLKACGMYQFFKP